MRSARPSLRGIGWRLPRGGAVHRCRLHLDGLVLLLGEREAWTPLPWHALEHVPDLLRARPVLIGSLYSRTACRETWTSI
jgi:hypothetical protein